MGKALTKQTVIQKVRQYLENQPLPEAMNGITLTVPEKKVYKENGYWRVPIQASSQPRWMYAFYEVLAEVEGDLDEKENLNILLVPTVVGETEALAA